MGHALAAARVTRRKLRKLACFAVQALTAGAWGDVFALAPSLQPWFRVRGAELVLPLRRRPT
jgi:hypothetical protein